MVVGRLVVVDSVVVVGSRSSTRRTYSRNFSAAAAAAAADSREEGSAAPAAGSPEAGFPEVDSVVVGFMTRTVVVSVVCPVVVSVVDKGSANRRRNSAKKRQRLSKCCV